MQKSMMMVSILMSSKNSFSMQKLVLRNLTIHLLCDSSTHVLIFFFSLSNTYSLDDVTFFKEWLVIKPSAKLIKSYIYRTKSISHGKIAKTNPSERGVDRIQAGSLKTNADRIQEDCRRHVHTPSVGTRHTAGTGIGQDGHHLNLGRCLAALILTQKLPKARMGSLPPAGGKVRRTSKDHTSAGGRMDRRRRQRGG